MKPGLFIMAVLLGAFLGAEGIVSLSPDITEVLLDLGLGNSITATVIQDPYPAGIKAGNFNAPDIERIVKLKPDIVYLTPVSQARTAAALKSLGIRTEFIYADSFEGLKGIYKKLGKEHGKGTEAGEAVRKIENFLAEFSGKPAKNLRALPVIWMDGKSVHSFGPGTFQGSALALLGLKNTAGFLKKRYGIIPYEKVLKSPPDIILVFSEDGERIKELILNDPVLSGLPAVKNGRVAVIRDFEPFFRASLKTPGFLKKLKDEIEKRD